MGLHPPRTSVTWIVVVRQHWGHPEALPAPLPNTPECKAVKPWSLVTSRKMTGKGAELPGLLRDTILYPYQLHLDVVQVRRAQKSYTSPRMEAAVFCDSGDRKRSSMQNGGGDVPDLWMRLFRPWGKKQISGCRNINKLPSRRKERTFQTRVWCYWGQNLIAIVVQVWPKWCLRSSKTVQNGDWGYWGPDQMEVEAAQVLLQ